MNKEKKLAEFQNATAATIKAIAAEKLKNREIQFFGNTTRFNACLLYTSPSPRDISGSRMPSSA